MPRGRGATSSRTNETPTPETPHPTPDREPAAEGPSLFRQPEPEPTPAGPGLVGKLTTPDPTPHPAAGPTTTGPGSWSEQSAGPGAAGGATPSQVSGSAPRSTRRRTVPKADLKRLAATAVRTAGGVLNVVLTAAHSAERDEGLWMPDDEDVRNISDPLAGLASRRMPEGADNPDAIDLGRLFAAVSGYVGKQLRRRTEIRTSPQRFYDQDGAAGGRREDRDQDAGDGFPPREPEQPAAGKPASGPLAFLRGRHDGATPTTDPQPDLDMSGGAADPSSQPERTGA